MRRACEPGEKRIDGEAGTAEQEDRKVDWYTLFKVSRNWQTGNFTSRQLHTVDGRCLDVRDSDAAHAGPSRLGTEVASQGQSVEPAMRGTLVDSTQSFVFTASHSPDEASAVPALLAFPSQSRDGSASRGDIRQQSLARHQSAALAAKHLSNVYISALAVDRRGALAGSVRLFLGYSNGDCCSLRFNTSEHIFHDEEFIDAAPSDIVVTAALCSPLLVTCTADFRIRIYHAGLTPVRFIEERRTYSCHWPATLRLDKLHGKGEKELFRLSVAYSSPVYPIGWTVGLQEIVLGTQSSIMSRSACARQAHIVTSIDSPSRDSKRRRLMGRPGIADTRRHQVGRLTSLSYEDPFIVVGTEDNDVVCFRVEGSVRQTDNLVSPPPLSLGHVCTFQGHTGTVHSVSLNEGRCVTGGSDGSVRVWRLGDEEAAVAKAAGLLTTMDASLRRGLGKVITIGSSLAAGKRKRTDVHAPPLSLADILRQARSGQGASSAGRTGAVVRWVTSAFDQIISVSAVKSTTGACRGEALIEREEEQVQIWNFAR